MDTLLKSMDWKSLDLLVVDDEPDICDILLAAFEGKGARVVSAANGREAFERFRAGAFQAVITDVRMPGGGGVEFLQRIRAHSHARPVVYFMSGFTDVSAEDAFEMGVDGVFHKPFEYKEILAAVARRLLPPGERWRVAAPAPVKILRADLASLDAARASSRLHFGRGGFFLKGVEAPIHVGQSVGFDIGFSSGSLSRLVGTGTIRWIRHGARGDLPAGQGIEIVSLEDACRDEVAAHLESLPDRAFIPRM